MNSFPADNLGGRDEEAARQVVPTAEITEETPGEDGHPEEAHLADELEERTGDDADVRNFDAGSFHEDLTQERSNLNDRAQRQHPADSQVRIRGRLTGGLNGWWRFDLDGPRPSALEVKFTDETNGDLQAIYLQRNCDASTVVVEMQLLEILENATNLRVNPSIGKGPMVKLAKALRMAANPVPVLECLEIFRRILGEVEIGSMFDAMNSRKFIRLSALVWDGVGLRNEDIRTLAGVMRAGLLPSLSKLSMRRNFFSSDAVMILAECLEPSDLRYLDLSENDIGAGHSSLAKLMESGHLPALEKLALNMTGIGDSGCEAYEMALRSGCVSALEEMAFARNGIGDRGARALARAYGSGKVRSLTCISLARNDITSDGMMALVTSLQDGGLRKLHLASNPVAEQGLISLARVLEAGHLNELEVLDVRFFGNTTEKGAKALLAALSRNNVFIGDVRLDWHNFPMLDLVRTQLVERNRKCRQILADLGGPWVPAAFAKVYVCGNPQVGKTTLTKSMQRSFWESMYTCERWPHAEKHTRGIDVYHLISKSKQAEKSITLVMWDMAGQNDYHLVHNAFLPDLASAEGKGTAFVVVCTSLDEKKAKQELDYWLRYIASSCQKGVHQPRHVLVVLNRIRGDSEVVKNAGNWKQCLLHYSEIFQGYLDIRTDPFIMDVRKRRFVKDIKRCLLERARHMLEHEKVPEICQFIQSNLRLWSEERKQFPVLLWTEFLKKVERTSRHWLENALEAAAKYLNEAGVVIYIDKEFPCEWDIPHTRLLVLDPTWFCREIVGNIFLPPNMVSDGERPFTTEVDKSTGSISISQFRRFFRPLLGEWNLSEIENLVHILVWLGLCYKGRGANVFIPALMDEDGKRGDRWGFGNSLEHAEDQWVMGYSVEYEQSEIALAPIALWHRYQVQLAQTPKFNGHALDNDYFAGRYYITFNVDYMAVLIEVNANQELPTFDCIQIFVKPLLKRDRLDASARKQCQVDLAGDLVEALMRLWNQVCPGVTYVQRVVWPWPASRPREAKPNRNVNVAEVKKWVEQHGPGRRMQWDVGFQDITEDQLLSSKDKRNLCDSVLESAHILRVVMAEAVELGIFPCDGLEVHGEKEASTGNSAHGGERNQPLNHPEDPKEESREVSMGQSQQELGAHQTYRGISGGPVGSAIQPIKDISENLLQAVSGVQKQVDVLVNGQGVLLDLAKMNIMESQAVRSDLWELARTQKEVLRKVQDLGNLFLEVRERSCPRFIYLGKKNSGAWMTLKEAMSTSVTVHLHFACEAHYNDYGQHAVPNQQGLDVSELKGWAKKIAPWLKVSLTILFISAKVAATVVAPSLGSILPSFIEWQQASELSEGIALATGYSQEELDRHMNERAWNDTSSTPRSPQELYGNSRKAMTEFLGRLTPREYKEKLGLQKVSLNLTDGSYHGVVWICSECYEKYRRSKLLSDL